MKGIPLDDSGPGPEGKRAGRRVLAGYQGEERVWLVQVACLMGSLGWWRPWLERREASWLEVRGAAC